MSEILRDITKAEFESDILQKEGYYLVDFWATWCPPCRFMLPILEGLAKDEELKDITILKADADKEGEMARDFEVSSLPTMFLIQTKGDGTYKVVDKFVGAQDGLTFKQTLLEKIS